MLLYLVRMADACGVDLAAASLDKLQKNARKYPVHLAHSSAAKYTELARHDAGSHEQPARPGAGAALQRQQPQDG